MDFETYYKKRKAEEGDSASFDEYYKKRKYEEAGIDTLSDDIKKYTEDIKGLTGWQTPEAMTEYQSRTNQLYKRIKSYRDYSGDASFDEILSGFDSTGKSLKDMAGIYSGYLNADAYNAAMDKYKKDEAAGEEWQKTLAGSTDEELERLYREDYSGGKQAGKFFTQLGKSISGALSGLGANAYAKVGDTERASTYAGDVKEEAAEAQSAYSDSVSKKADIKAEQSRRAIAAIEDKVSSMPDFEAKVNDKGQTPSIYKYAVGNGRNYYANYSEKQKKTLLYLQETDTEKAKAYEELIKPMANQTAADKIKDKYTALADKSPVLASIISVATNLDSGRGYIDTVGTEIMNIFGADKSIDTNKYVYDSSRITTAIRDTISKNLEEKYKAHVGQTNVASFSYQTAMSIMDCVTALVIGNAIGGLAGGGAAASSVKGASGFSNAVSKIKASIKNGEAFILGTMSAGAATAKVIECREKGLSNAQSAMLGTIAGFAEFITEKVSIEALIADPKTVLGYLRRNAFTEGAEEVGSDVINLFGDLLIAANKAEIREEISSYMAAGYTQNEAFGMALGNQAESMFSSFAGGAISGLAFGGFGAAADIKGKYDTGAMIRDSGAESDLAQLAMNNTDVKSPEYKLGDKLSKRIDRKKKISKYSLGKLYMLVSENVAREGTEAAKAADENFKKALASAGATEAQINRTYDIMTEFKDKIDAGEEAVISDEDADFLATLPEGADKLTNDYVSGSETEREKGLYALQKKTMDPFIKAVEKANEEKETQNEGAETENAGETGAERADGWVAKGAERDINKQYEGADIEIKELSWHDALAGYGNIYAASAQQEFYSAAPAMDESASVEEKTKAARRYAFGYRIAYQYGYYNLHTKEFTAAQTEQTGLTKEQLTLAYVSGKAQKFRDNQAEDKKTKAKSETVTVRSGSVDLSKIKKIALNKRQAAAVKAAGMISRATGIKFSFFAGGKENDENGSYDKNTNTIRVDIYAGTLKGDALDASIMNTISHELTHYIAGWSKAQFGYLKSFIQDNVLKYDENEMQREIDRVLMEEKAATGKMRSWDWALEEIICDGCETMLRDTNAFNQLQNQNKTLWQEIKEKVTEFFRKLSRLLKDAYDGVEAVTDTGKILREVDRQTNSLFKEMQKLWDEGFADAVRNQNDAGKNEAEEAEEKHSYAGRRAKTANFAKLSEAVKMLEEGVDSETESFDKNSPKNSSGDDITSRDAEYMELAKDPEKNKGKLQEMVEEAARDAGFAKKAYHGTQIKFNKFDIQKGGKDHDTRAYDEDDDESAKWKAISEDGASFATNKDYARQYGENIIEAYLRVGEQYDIYYDDLMNMEPQEIREMFKSLKNGDYDGTVYDSVYISDSLGNDEIKIFDPENIKSAEPITYDDEGNVIPLSERFKADRTGDEAWKNDDTRYQKRRTGYFNYKRADARDIVSEITSIISADDKCSELNAKLPYDARNQIIQYITDILNQTPEEERGGIIDFVADTILNRFIKSDMTSQTDGVKKEDTAEKPVEDKPDEKLTEGMKKEDIAELHKKIKEQLLKSFEDIKKSRKRRMEDNNNKRLLLMNAPMTVAENDTDRSWLKQYRSCVIRLSASAARLNDAIVDYTLKYEGRDDLSPKEAIEAANARKKIESFRKTNLVEEKHLKIMEAREAIIRMEKTAIRLEMKAAEDNSKKAIKELSDYYDVREGMIKEQLEENARIKREGMKKTELRNKISKLSDKLVNMMRHPTEKKYIPDDVISRVVSYLNYVGTDLSVYRARLAKYEYYYTQEGDAQRKQHWLDLAKKTEEIMQKKADESNKARETVSSIHSAYQALLKNQETAVLHDEVLDKLLEGLEETVGETPIYRMSLYQLQQVYNAGTAIMTRALDAGKFVLAGKTYNALDVQKECINQMQNTGYQIKDKALSELIQKGILFQLPPERLFRWLSGYAEEDRPGLNSLYKILNDGQKDMYDIQNRGTSLLAPVLKGKENTKDCDKLRKFNSKSLVDVGLKDDEGNTVHITRGMMVSLYMHLLNRDNARHILGGGLNIPSLRKYYKGQRVESYSSGNVFVYGTGLSIQDMAKELEDAERHGDTERIVEAKYMLGKAFDNIEAIRADLMAKTEELLSDYEKKWIAAAQEVFKYSADCINKTTMKRYGFLRATMENYFPIHVEKDLVRRKDNTNEDISHDFSVESWGAIKERVKSYVPILLEDISDVVPNHINYMARYAGMVNPLDYFNRIYKSVRVKTVTVGTGDKKETKQVLTSFSTELKKIYGGYPIECIDNLIADLNGARQRGDRAGFADRLRGGYAGAVLTLNPTVTLSQPSAHFAAAAELGWSATMRAWKHYFSPINYEKIRKYSVLLDYRANRGMNQEVADARNSGGLISKGMRKAPWLFDWISAMDNKTVATLWYGCEYATQDEHPELKKESEEYYKEVGHRFDLMIERTQSNYATMQRPEALRNNNQLVKSIMMFRTQSMQNFGILFDAAGNLKAKTRMYKQNKSDTSLAQLKEAKKYFVRAITSQAVQAAAFAALKVIGNALMHRMDKYRDDDDELTAGGIALGALDETISTLLGSCLGIGEAYDIITSIIKGDQIYDFISEEGFETVNNLISDGAKLINSFDDGFSKVFDSSLSVLSDITRAAGVPFDNVKKIFDAVINHATDIIKGDFLSFESGFDRSTASSVGSIYKDFSSGHTDKAKKRAKELASGMSDSAMKAALTREFKDMYISANGTGKTEIRKFIALFGVYKNSTEIYNVCQKWTIKK